MTTKQKKLFYDWLIDLNIESFKALLIVDNVENYVSPLPQQEVLKALAEKYADRCLIGASPLKQLEPPELKFIISGSFVAGYNASLPHTTAEAPQSFIDKMMAIVYWENAKRMTQDEFTNWITNTKK